MKNGIYLVIYLITEMLNCLLAYGIIFEVGFSKKKKNWILGMSFIFAIHFLLLFCGGMKAAENLTICTMLVIPCLFLEQREKKNFLLYPVVIIGTSLFGVSSSFLFAMFFQKPEYQLLNDYWFVLLCQSVPAVLMIFLLICRKMRRRTSIPIELNTRQYCLFYFGIICEFLLIASLQEFSASGFSDETINIYAFAVSLTCIAFTFMSYWQGVVAYREMYYKKQNEVYEEYMRMQEQQIRTMMELDETMREFRHDMNTHFKTLKVLCKHEKNQEVEKYLDNMIEKSGIYEMRAYTGNKAADAIIRQMMAQAGEKQIEMKINGNLPIELKISVYDICTILSNVLQNAIEACEKVDHIEKRKIEAEILVFNEEIFIRIGNTVAREVVIKDNKLITSKQDKKNHGLGSKNVEKTVKKYEGSILYSCKDGWFEVEICI